MGTIEQQIELPLRPGSRIVLYENVEIDRSGEEDIGAAVDIQFEGYVDRYIPDTSVLDFVDSDVSLSEFESMVREADGYEIITNPDTR